MGPAEINIRSTGSEKWTILKLSVFAVLICDVSMWTYHTVNRTMDWTKARDTCQKDFTGMVFMRNKKENEYLNQTLSEGSPYYWIGIIKRNNTWIWEKTQEVIPENITMWAPGEPTNSSRETCVELYIKRPTDSGSWNNHICSRMRRPLCYQDNCNNSTCNHHGECKEDIGNYTCECWPGFHGNNCEHAVSCVNLQLPANATISCVDEYGVFQYKSFCNFSCNEGYELSGTKAVFCQNTGEWSEMTPTCLAVSCVDLQTPANGKITCTDKYGKSQYETYCNFSCNEGYELNGTKSVFCQNTGEWSEPTPTCSAVICADLQIPANGKINCTNEYGKSQYKSFCNFSCDEGYELNGTTSVFCQNTGEWSEATPTCLALNVSFGKQKQVAIVSSVLGTVGLSVPGIAIVYILNYLRKKKKECSHIMKTNKNPPNTFENPAFEDKEIDSSDL